MPKIDWNTVITVVIAGVILFLLQKYLTKKVTSPTTGEVKQYVGFGGATI